MDKIKILIIEDDKIDMKRYSEYLLNNGSFQADILEAASAKQGIALCQENDIDCILLDYYLPEMDGLEVLKVIRKTLKNSIPIIMITGFGNENLAVSAMKEGATDYIRKANDNPDILIKTITSAVNHVKLQNQIELSKDLNEQKKILVAQQQIRHELLENMSHELNTPLNPIMGYAQLIYNGKLGEINSKQKDALSTIIKNSQHLQSLIRNAIDILSFEVGHIVLHPEEVRISQVLNKIKDNFIVPLTEKNQELICEIDKSIENLVIDPVRLQQILFQYLSNAIKFGFNNSKIHIRVKAENENMFRVEVQDQGIGIEESKIKNLFIVLNQCDASTSKEYQGLGLGLSLTKHIAKAMNGYVGVTSKVGEGSVFYVVLPLIQVDELVEA